MSWFSNGVHAVGKAVTDTGHAVGKVATNPWVQGLTAAALTATGVGAPAAAAILAAQKGVGNLIKPGGNIKHAATGALQGAALGAGSALAGGAVKKLGATALSHFLPGQSVAQTNTDPNAGSGDAGYGTDGDGGNYGGNNGFGDQGQNVLGEANDWLKSNVPGTQSIENFLKGAGGKAVSAAGNFLGGNGGMNALGIAQGINAAGLQSKADDYAKQAVSGVQDSYNQRAPLRVAGIQGMLNPQTPNLAGLTANSGPYGKGLPAIAPARAFSAPGA